MNKEYIKKIRFEFYYRRVNRVLSFLINKEKRVFYYGTVIEGLIPCFNSSYCKIPMHYNARFYGTSKSKAIQHGFILFKMACNGYWTFRTFLPGKK